MIQHGVYGAQQKEKNLPRDINGVLSIARSRVTQHVFEAMAPPQLVGQVRLASHEVIARFCRALKGDDDLGIHLRQYK